MLGQHILPVLKSFPLRRGQEQVLRGLLAGTALFNGVDYVLTVVALHLGYRELNPLMDLVVYTPYFPLVKLALVPLLLCFIWTRRDQVGQRVLLYSWAVFLAYLLLMLYFKLHIWMWLF